MTAPLIGQIIDQRIAERVRQMVIEAEEGTITASGLQLTTFTHPIRGWWVVGTPPAIGDKVLAIAMGRDEYCVMGPMTRQGVS